MLLRKTRSESVSKTIQELFKKFPDLQALAKADLTRLKKILKPLGLSNLRSVAVRNAAKKLLEDHGGKVPSRYPALIGIPHVGRYIANATLCFGFGKRVPVVDANVVRIFNRMHGLPVPIETHKADSLWEFAESLLPRSNFKNYNLALLDLGATVCKPRNPSCVKCPVAQWCKLRKRLLRSRP